MRKRATRQAILRDIAAIWGVRIAERPVCAGHHAPMDFVAAWVFQRPSVSLVHGPRGGGKSFLRAFATHVDSLGRPPHSTRVLGGSLAQSKQVYAALKGLQFQAADVIRYVRSYRAEYVNGSEVEILSASPRSVRGPHVPTLCLDEVDEIDPDIRQSAAGMCMAKGGVRASIAMTSTWHRVRGADERATRQGRSRRVSLLALLRL